MTQYPLLVTCNVTVQTLITEHPMLTPLPETFGISEQRRLLRSDRRERLLSEDAPMQHTSVGLAFRFPRSLAPPPGTRLLSDATDAALLHPLLSAWAPDIKSSAPLVALVVDGQAVAVCGSVRITPQAHEAGLETAAPFRRLGFGKAVVAAWSSAVRARGSEPLYSTTWQNDASRAFAGTHGSRTRPSHSVNRGHPPIVWRRRDVARRTRLRESRAWR